MRLIPVLSILVVSGSGVFGQATIQTITGTGTCGFGGDNGPAAQAAICGSQGIAVDSSGNIYFADTLNYRIRKITSNGPITTLAGSGLHGSDGDNGTALYASLGTISHVVVDNGGWVVFSDPEAHKVRYLFTTGGAIYGIGTGNAVSGGDGQPWTSISLNQPSGLVTFFMNAGGVGGGGGGPVCTYPIAYVADAADNIVRRLDANANSTIVGPGTPGQLGDGGPATAASLLNPGGLAYYNNCGLYIADTGHHRIRKVDLSTGIITTVAGDGTPAFGGDGGPATSAQLNSPTHIALDQNGNLYVTDSGNLRVRMIDTAGVITTVAGNGSFGFGADNVPATTSSFLGISGAALLSYPTRVLVSDGSNRVRQVNFGQTTNMGLSISPNPALQGDTINLTATVVPSAATGTVTFTANSQTIGTFSVAGGQAIGSWYSFNPGSYSIAANYSGDSNYAPSFVTGTLNVQTPTATALSSSLNPSTQGQPVTFTMTVSPAESTGTVDLFGVLNGSPLYLGRATLANGTASITSSSLGAGSNTLYAVYNSDATHARSTSPEITQTVNAALTSTTTSVASSPNPSTAGAQVTLTATVSPSAATGSVQFNVNGSSFATATLSGGQAQITTPYLPTGVDPITATYSGNANYAASTSGAIQQTVNKASTNTSLTSSPNPSTTGALVTLTATVTPSGVVGNVQFFNNGTLLGSSAIAGGQAQFPISSLPAGTNSLTATYVGDANNASSTSGAVQQVVKAAATVGLSSSGSPSTLGAAVTLTATVTPSDATGTVQFVAINSGNTFNLGAATVAGGVATLTTTDISSGSNSITAQYGGDASHGAATSAAITQMIRFTSYTVLSASPNPSELGAAVVLTAIIYPANNGQTGTVQFLNGATVLGSAAVNASGQAQLTTSALALGANSLTASYSGDTYFANSTSNAIQQTVNKTASTTTLAANPGTSNFGAAVTLTATVSPSTATGTVQFFNGATLLGSSAVGSGQAQLVTSALPVGSNSLTAGYGGDSNLAASNSGAVQQTVNKAPTATTFSTSPSPSTFGQAVTLTASVAPSTATGSIEFFNGGTSLGTVALTNGQAQLVVTTLPVGTNALTGPYSGDANFLSSSSYASQTVNKAATTAVLSANPGTSTPGQTVTLTATVAPAAATGSVQFFNGATSLGTATLTNGQAQLAVSTLPVGTNSLTAAYGSDANYNGSTSGAVQQTVNKTATTTALSASPSPSTVGQAVTLTANVTPTSATGTVQFFSGGTPLGSASVAGGQAQLAVSTLAAGTNSLTATYSGDANYNTSTSSAVQQTVNKASSTTGITTNPVSPSVGQTVSIVATVTPSAATGTVNFYKGAALLGSSSLSGGQASWPVTVTAAGTSQLQNLQAVYQGSATYNASSSATITVNVAKGATTTAIASSLNPSVQGQAVTFTATVTPSVATGTVTFTGVGSAGLVNGVASITTSSLAAGTTTVTAQYGGDANYNSSSSAGLAQVVKVVTTTSLTSSPNPSTFGGSVTLNATVTPSSTTGTVQFFNGATLVGSASLSGGHALLATTALPGGTNSLTATYTGNATSAASTSSVRTQTVNKANSTTTFSASPGSPSHVGQTVTFTATVTPSAATGTVEFRDGGNTIGTGTLSNGAAVFATSALGQGNHQIRAVYVGDGNVNSSQSGQQTYHVNP